MTALAGVLLAAVVVLDFIAGEPPSDGAGLLAWMEDNRVVLILIDEALVFAGLALLAAAALGRNAVTEPLRTRLNPLVGLALLTTALMFVTSLAGGRFVYPVHGIEVDDAESVALVAGLFYGGIHMIWLALAVLCFAVAVATRGQFARAMTAACLIAAGFAVAASYPEVLGPVLTLGVRLVVVGWMLLLAATLPAAVPTATGPSAETISSEHPRAER